MKVRTNPLHENLLKIEKYVRKHGDGITHANKLIGLIKIIAIGRPQLIAGWNRQPIISKSPNDDVIIKLNNGGMIVFTEHGDILVNGYKKTRVKKKKP